MSYWYLATPYALYPLGKQAAYEEALRQTATSGIPVYSPIVHNHPLSLLPEMQSKEGSFDFWVNQVDQPLMDGAFGLLVCKMVSWEDSKGVRYEMDRFMELKKPVVYYFPGEIPVLGSESL